LVVGLALVFGGGLLAQEVKIGTINVAPFGMTGTDGKPTGMMWEISNKIAETAGLKYTNVLVPYARSVLALGDGTIDFLLRFNNPELPGVSIPVAPVVTMPTIILSRKENSFPTLESLHGKSVGMLRGGVFDDRFAKDEAIKKAEVSDYDQMMKMMFAGRFDASIGSNVGLYYVAKEQGITPDQLGKPLILSKQDFILHFSKKNGDEKVMQALRTAVETLRKNGTIEKIIDKYMGGFQWNATN
jgi:ABC-type amino acid transport substrate-binding protein